MFRRIVVAAAAAAAVAHAADARACGCFAMGNTAQPVVQAGERILFAHEGDQVIAYIQIKYQGAADQFGWIVPLPTVPTLEVGTDQLFTMLDSATLPQYRLTTNQQFCSGGSSSGTDVDGEGGCGFGGASASPNYGGGAGSDMGVSVSRDMAAGGVVVQQASIGPYDYAVLHADDESAMLQWLSDNRYFVPAGTDAAVMPYIHPGAYFLALKLKKGNDVGDLQPVVVKYQSDLPMIPLVLTSVAANPHMGIQVWMLGDGRAIPRNYYHTVINDAKLDWVNGSQNYNDVIIAATAEAPDKHSFVTEYAGTSGVMQGQLDAPGRFGVQSELAASATDVEFASYMQQHQFPFTAQTVAVLQKYIPEPTALVNDGIQPPQFYSNLSYWLGSYRQQNPADFSGWTENFQPVMMAQDLQDRVVTPTLAAGALFSQFPYLTRLYTTLSPEDMNKDPVFSYNPGLKDWSNVHNGTLTYHCGFFGDRGVLNTAATLRTETGWVIDYPNGTGAANGAFTPPGGPSSQRIEILREEGNPDVIVDNTSSISNSLGGGGCGMAVGGRASRQAVGFFGLVAVLGIVLVGRRRRAS